MLCLVRQQNSVLLEIELESKGAVGQDCLDKVSTCALGLSDNGNLLFWNTIHNISYFMFMLLSHFTAYSVRHHIGPGVTLCYCFLIELICKYNADICKQNLHSAPKCTLQ